MSFRDEVITLLCDTAVSIFGCARSTLGRDTCFEEDLHCKSTDIVKFTVALEDAYEVEVPFMAFKRNKTFDDAAEYMCDVTGYE